MSRASTGLSTAARQCWASCTRGSLTPPPSLMEKTLCFWHVISPSPSLCHPALVAHWRFRPFGTPLCATCACVWAATSVVSCSLSSLRCVVRRGAQVSVDTVDGQFFSTSRVVRVSNKGPVLQLALPNLLFMNSSALVANVTVASGKS